MAFFGANSVLNRAAVAGGHIEAIDFGTIRLLAGAMMLVFLCKLSQREMIFRGKARILGALSLFVYIYGFSLAYDTLDAGLGALVLFGVVQITMFVAALLSREAMPITRWLGAGLASAGLALLLWPEGEGAIGLYHTLFMAAAGVGWGLYSLMGATSRDALSATASHFAIAALLGLLLSLALPGHSAALEMTGFGILLAFLSGAITSGLGYALWYKILPSIDLSAAAVVQLSVPIIALTGGIVFLGEVLTLRFALCTLLVLGGIAISLSPQRKTRSAETS